MSASQSGLFSVQEFTDAGGPLVGGRLYTYAFGTTTPKTAYTDIAGVIPHTYTADGSGGQYIALNARGELSAPLYLLSGSYDIALKRADGSTVWTRRADPVEDFAVSMRALLAASAGSGLVGFSPGGAGALSTVETKLRETVTATYAGGIWNGVSDVTGAAQLALSSGAKVVDFLGLPGKITTSLTIPAGVEARNVNFTAGTAGMNMLLVNTGSKVNGKLTGTGTTSIIERGIYPAADGVTDVTLDIEVLNLTVGVQAQNIGAYVVGNYPKRWKGNVYAHNIVGTAGSSEGYGVLLSPALDCELTVQANTIARHALYLSAGAKGNKITLHVDGCLNYAAQLYSSSGQDATQFNTVHIKARNLGQNVAGQSGAVAIVQNTHHNTITLECEGNGAVQFAATVQGVSGGPYPLNNRIIDGIITGQFLGADVINLQNADSTVVRGNRIAAYATSSCISSRTSGTNGSTHGGYIFDNVINAQGANCIGVYAENTIAPTFIGLNDIRATGASLRVYDSTAGKRYGFSRRVTFSGATASIPAMNSADTSVTLSDDLQTVGRFGFSSLTGSSVQFFNLSFWSSLTAAPTSTTATLRAYNAHSVAQTMSYSGVVEGD